MASSQGGTATRLTAHPGLELFPAFSPDGAWVAFTGQYDGDEQVYVIPGDRRRAELTYYPARGPLAPRWGYDNQVYDWTPDGRSVLFRSLRYSTDLSDSRLFLASIDGGLPDPAADAGVGRGRSLARRALVKALPEFSRPRNLVEARQIFLKLHAVDHAAGFVDIRRHEVLLEESGGSMPLAC